MCPSKLLATGILASVVVSKFATFRYRSPSELRNQNDTRNQYVASVLSIPKFAKRRYRDVANFGIGTLGLPWILPLRWYFRPPSVNARAVRNASIVNQII